MLCLVYTAVRRFHTFVSNLNEEGILIHIFPIFFGAFSLIGIFFCFLAFNCKRDSYFA